MYTRNSGPENTKRAEMSCYLAYKQKLGSQVAED